MLFVALLFCLDVKLLLKLLLLPLHLFEFIFLAARFATFGELVGLSLKKDTRQQVLKANHRLVLQVSRLYQPKRLNELLLQDRAFL
jgi:hypothetical protein